MDEEHQTAEAAAEVLGTALLVFIGVGAVPATLIVNGDATVHDGRPRHHLVRVRHGGRRHRLRARPVSGNHINPARHPRVGHHRQVPLEERARLHRRPGSRSDHRRVPAIVGVLGPKAARGRARVAQFNKSLGVGNLQGFFAEFVGTFILVFVIFGVIHRKASRASPVWPSASWCSPPSSRWRRRRPPSINPARAFGPMLVLQAFGGAVHWAQLPVYLCAELSGGVAAGAYTVIAPHATLGRMARSPATENSAPDSRAADSPVAAPVA